MQGGFKREIDRKNVYTIWEVNVAICNEQPPAPGRGTINLSGQ